MNVDYIPQYSVFGFLYTFIPCIYHFLILHPNNSLNYLYIMVNSLGYILIKSLIMVSFIFFFSSTFWRHCYNRIYWIIYGFKGICLRNPVTICNGSIRIHR